MSTQLKPYGNWRSPITSSRIAGGGLELLDLKILPNAEVGMFAICFAIFCYLFCYLFLLLLLKSLHDDAIF